MLTYFSLIERRVRETALRQVTMQLMGRLCDAPLHRLMTLTHCCLPGKTIKTLCQINTNPVAVGPTSNTFDLEVDTTI